MRTRFIVLATILALVAIISGVTVATSSPPVLVNELGQLEIPAKEAVVLGTTVYIIDGGCTSVGTPPEPVCEGILSVVDVQNSAFPEVLGQVTTETEAFDELAADGDYLYAVVRGLPADYWSPVPYRLAVMDVSDPTSITELTTIDLGENLGDPRLEMGGEFLVIASRTFSVTFFDLTDPAVPVEMGHLETTASDIALDGTKLYVAKESTEIPGTLPDGLQIFDVSDPAAPVKLGETRGSFRGVSAFGAQAFVIERAVCSYGDGGDYLCGTSLMEYDVANPANPVRRGVSKPGWGDGYPLFGGQGAWIGKVVKHGNFLLVPEGRLHVLNLDLPDRAKVGEYNPVFGENPVGFVVDVELSNGNVVAVARATGASGIRTLQVKPAIAQAFLAYIAREGPGTAFAGPDEERFGIGESDKGSDINWGAQGHFWANGHDWGPNQSTSWRQYYTGPDVYGTWIFAHSPDTYSEGPIHFGSGWKGPVSNGASDPMVDGSDVYWVSNHHGDMASEYATANAEYWDPSLGHWYNRNHHGLLPPGGHHLHDTHFSGSGHLYVDCYDIAGFNP